MKLLPTDNRVCVRVDEVEVKTSGGIILAVNEEMKQAQMQLGTILDVGPTVTQETSKGTIKIGDKVLFQRFAGILSPTSTDNEKIRIMLEGDIKGVIEDE